MLSRHEAVDESCSISLLDLLCLERSLEQMLSRPAFVQRVYLRRGENDLVV